MYLKIESFNHQGEGVAKSQGLVYFVPHTVPGDVVEVVEVEDKKRFKRAEVVRLLEPSKDRLDSPCPRAKECGGCTWSMVEYRAQIRAKRKLVADALERIGKLNEVEIKEVVASDEPFGYRNKAILHLARNPKGKIEVGFYRRGSNQIVSSSCCLLLPEKVRELVGFIAEHLDGPHFKDDLPQELVVRRSWYEDKILVIFKVRRVSNHLRDLISDLISAIPEVKGVMVKTPARLKVLQGEGILTEKLLGLKLRLTGEVFFQVNTGVAEKMAEKVRFLADLNGEEKVVDGYCGIGTLSLPLASGAQKLIGIEEDPTAVADARANALANDFKNVRFLGGRCEDLLPAVIGGEGKIDLVVLDPPRGGLSSQVIKTLVRRKPKAILYVSCHPATLGRDLGLLVEHGYRVQDIQPFDMFPLTPHVECVTLMSRVEE